MGTPAARPVTAAARPQQVAAASPLAQKAPGGMAPQPSRSTGSRQAPQASSSLAFLAPLVAALAALSGLGYAVFRKRKRPLPGAARSAGAAPPQPGSPATPAEADGPSTPPAATPRRGFNYDEVRRVNVGRVFMAPLPQATTGTGGAAAVETTNAGGNTEAADHPPADGVPPANTGKVVQHANGDVVQGIVAEIYDTPEAKARVDGFYEHIPAEFQDLTWMKVTYHQGQIYTLAAAMPGLVMHPGDTVRLVFGQQDPPVPNQVVAVVHLQSPSSGADAGIMDGPA
jgi:hypothetical protein